MFHVCVEKKSRGSSGTGPWRRRRSNSVRMGLFVVQASGAAGAERGAADDLHPPAETPKKTLLTLRRIITARPVRTSQLPLKSVFTLRSEVVDVGLEMEFEDVVLVDVLRVRGDADRVTQKRKAGQGIVILQGQHEIIQLNTFISKTGDNSDNILISLPLLKLGVGSGVSQQCLVFLFLR